MPRRPGWRSFLATVLLITSCSTSGGAIERLVITNRTSYDLEIAVTDARREGWVPLGRTLRGETSTHEMVADLGDIWIFRFEYAARVLGGELRVGREQLEADDWEVVVPDRVEDRLRAEGIKPSPER